MEVKEVREEVVQFSMHGIVTVFVHGRHMIS